MSELQMPAPLRRFPVRRQVNLGWAFVERQTNLWKRHWAWEVVWLVYGVVNTLAITFIAKQLTTEGVVTGTQANRLTLFLLIGTLVWAYLSAILDDISLVITWERCSVLWLMVWTNSIPAGIERSKPSRVQRAMWSGWNRWAARSRPAVAAS